jgi:hypothetical protein
MRILQEIVLPPSSTQNSQEEVLVEEQLTVDALISFQFSVKGRKKNGARVLFSSENSRSRTSWNAEI